MFFGQRGRCREEAPDREPEEKQNRPSFLNNMAAPYGCHAELRK